MRQLFIALTLCITPSLLVAKSTPMPKTKTAANKKAPAANPVYHSKEKGFTIILPAGWEQQKDMMGAEVVAISAAEGANDTFRENINVVVEKLPQKMVTKDYYKSSLDVLKKVFIEFKLEKTGQAKVNGREFYYTIFTHKMNDVAAKILQYLAVNGDTAYVITASAAPDKFDKYKPIFEKSIQSFKADDKKRTVGSEKQ